MTRTVYPEWARDLEPISGLHLRRAVIRTLLRSDAGHQVRRGRVRRVGRGRYEAIPEAISRTNHWRIANWERFV